MANVGQSKRRKPEKRHAEIVRGFAAKLRETRNIKNLTQASLARKAHVTVPYIGRLERGGASPGIDMLGRLAAALDVTPADLLPNAAATRVLDEMHADARTSLQNIIEKAGTPTFAVLIPFLKMIEHALNSKS